MDDLPLLEFDPSPTAVIEPSATVGRFTVPEAVVVCFFRDAIERLAEAGGATRLGDLVSEMGRHPVLRLELEGHVEFWILSGLIATKHHQIAILFP